MDLASENDILNCPTISCDDYTHIRQKPVHKWNSNQRVILAYLVLFGNSWKELRAVFNSCFKDDLASEAGLSSGALSSMHYCMELSEDEQNALALLKDAPSSTQSFSCESLAKLLIKKAADDLNILLVPRDSNVLPKATRHSKQLPPYKALKSNDEDSATLQTGRKRKSSYPQQTPTKKRSQQPLNSLMTPPDSGKVVKQTHDIVGYDVPQSRRLAVLGFRAFSKNLSMGTNASRGFVAGAFVEIPDNIPQPPDPQSHEYLEKANLRESDSRFSSTV